MLFSRGVKNRRVLGRRISTQHTECDERSAGKQWLVMLRLRSKVPHFNFLFFLAIADTSPIIPIITAHRKVDGIATRGRLALSPAEHFKYTFDCTPKERAGKLDKMPIT